MKKIPRQRVSTNYTVSVNSLRYFGGFIAETQDVIISLPQAAPGMEGLETEITNVSSGWISVVVDNGFLNQEGICLLAPNEYRLFVPMKVGGSTWKWAHSGEPGGGMPWTPWAPVLTFTNGTPSITESSFLYRVNPLGVCHGEIYISGPNGNGATGLTITPPPGGYPRNLGFRVPASGGLRVDNTWYNPLGYLDAAASAVANRVIAFRKFYTLTSGKSFTIHLSFVYPVGDFISYTPSATWTGGPPTGGNPVGGCCLDSGTCLGYVFQSFSDGKGATAVTYTPPLLPLKSDLLVPIASYEIAGAGSVITNPISYLDAAQAAVGDRLLKQYSLSQMTDTQSAEYALALQYGVVGDSLYNPNETFGTKPTGWTSKMLYRVSRESKVVYFEYYGSSNDGKGNTTLMIPLPIPPKYESSAVTSLSATQKVGTTFSDPIAYIDRSMTGYASRAMIRFRSLSTMTDGAATAVGVSGFYPVG